MKRVGSASEESHDSHARPRGCSAAHDASMAVLPYPAGAATIARR